MKFNLFMKYYSYSRASKYYKATSHNKVKTMILYNGNLKISQVFYPLLGVLEVILRNRIHREMAFMYSDKNWIINQKTGFMSDKSLTKKDKRTGKSITNDYLLKEVVSAEKKLKKKGVTSILAGQIIAEQTLGFWTSFFDVPYYRILKGAPTKAFKYLPAGYGRKDISNTLFEIREFRNRIFHNEPVCFVNNKIDFSYARSIYASIINILVWVDPKIKTSLLEIDRVLKVIDDEERKQNNP